MRLMSYRRGEARGWGAVIDGGVVDLSKRSKHADLKSALAAGDLAQAEKATKGAKPDFALADASFDLPIPNAEKIFCVGRNYPEYHEVAEMNARPKYPSIFPRWANSFAAHGEAILKPKASDQLDFEGELAVIIGKRGRHVPPNRAFDHIVGYTCLNEGSVRDWQGYGTQNCPGKNFYHSGSIGPWMVTKDEIEDPMALALKTRLNGETLQDNKVGEMLFDIPYVLAHISKFTWIEAGDLITMGSPGGTIISRKTGNWMKPGDAFELEIENIGTLKNPVAAE